MPRPTPVHERTSALNHSLLWKEWAGYAAVRQYAPHTEAEYFALRNAAGLLDVSPLYKYDVEGPDAAALLARVFTRDIEKASVGSVSYSAMADERGKCLDDGTVARLADTRFRVTTSEPWLHWLHRHGRGFDVTVTDTSTRYAALAVQGPKSRDILAPLVGFDLNKMRFFRVRETTVAGVLGAISRTGYTGDLGFELWIPAEHAVAVYDAVLAAGAPHGLLPVGLDALDVARIEAGFVLQGVDYTSARACITEARKSSPFEAGLGWTVDLDRGPFVGSEALAAEQKAGPAWSLVGVEIDVADLEALYARYGLPPHLAPIASRVGVPIYDASGHRQIGQLTSSTWSPLLKRYIGIGQVRTAFAKEGTVIRVEHTPEYTRGHVAAKVVATPFFDPPRKKDVPGGKSGGGAA